MYYFLFLGLFWKDIQLLNAISVSKLAKVFQKQVNQILFRAKHYLYLLFLCSTFIKEISKEYVDLALLAPYIYTGIYKIEM